MANWVSHLSIYHVVRLGYQHFVGFLLVETSFQTLENSISEYYVYQGDITSLTCMV